MICKENDGTEISCPKRFEQIELPAKILDHFS